MKTIAIWLLMMIPLCAQAVDWGQARLLDGGQDDDGVFWMGFEIELNEGWKTYWQYAGQNGLDPEIILSLDGEEIPSEVHWPKAHLFLADDLPSVGYKEHVIVPISFEVPLGAKVDFEAYLGVCETVCVPVQVQYDFAATGGYSFDQVFIREQPTPDDAPLCDWSKADLAKLDASQYWMFVDETGYIDHQAPEGFSKGAIYALSEDDVAAVDCP